MSLRSWSPLSEGHRMVPVSLDDSKRHESGQGSRDHYPPRSKVKTSPNERSLTRNPPSHQWRKAEERVINLLSLTCVTGNTYTIKKKTKFFRSFKLAGVNVPIFTKLPPASPFLDLTMVGLYSPFLPLPGLSNMSRGLVLNVMYETQSLSRQSS